MGALGRVLLFNASRRRSKTVQPQSANGGCMSRALVTGANRGIGMATAITLARGGHSVIAAMRNVSAAGELQNIAAAENLSIATVALDVTDDASVSHAFSSVLREHGPIDVLVNNAGISGGGSVEEAPLQQFHDVMETNFFGALRCIKAVAPGMRERRCGTIINISSVSGRVASAPQAPYAASKFALEAMSEVLAQEMKIFNVRVAIIEPGIIDTAIVGSATKNAPKDSPYPQARRLLAVYAASAKQNARTSPYVVGEQILHIVDGDSWQLRYPVGPDAVKFLSYRASRSDEEIISMTGASDAEYTSLMKREFGLDIRL
jgi:NAD(P)-dependent dehydrogenase (short-subunit alcohol dehydrogenase family)